MYHIFIFVGGQWHHHRSYDTPRAADSCRDWLELFDIEADYLAW